MRIKAKMDQAKSLNNLRIDIFHQKTLIIRLCFIILILSALLVFTPLNTYAGYERGTTLSYYSMILGSNFKLYFAVSGCFIILIYYLILWRLVGKDRYNGDPIVPLHDPPESLSPAAIRTIYRKGVDSECLTIALVSLAIQGFITIQTVKDGFRVTKQKDEQADMASEERLIFRRLFSTKKFFLFIHDDFRFRLIDDLEKDLTRQLRLDYENAYYITNKKYWVIGLMSSLVFTGPVLLEFITDIKFYILMIFVFGLVIPFTMFRSIIGLSLGVLAMLIIALIAINNNNLWNIFNLNWVDFAAIIMVTIINWIFSVLLKAPSARGAKLLPRITGFKMYLEERKDQFAAYNPMEPTGDSLEKYLPYAVALGIKNPWVQQLSGEIAWAQTTSIES